MLFSTHRLLRATVLALLAGFWQSDLESSRADDRWADWRAAGPFVCRADFSLAGMEGLLSHLARLEDDLVRYLGIRPAGERIEIYLFHNESAYRHYLNRQFPQVPYRRALYVKSGGPGMVLAYQSRELGTDLRHECTHALLHASLPMVPLWLDEGLAEYFEVPPEHRAFNSTHLSTIRLNAHLGVAPSLAKMETIASLSEMKGAEYRDAWAWVHFMLHGSREAHAELVAFFDDIEAATPPGSLSDRLRKRMAEPERQLLRHFRHWKR